MKIISILALSILVITLSGANLFAEDQATVKQSLIFVFRSPGTGIDSTVAKSVEAILGNLVANSKISTYRKLHWGHEGELTICIQIEDKDIFSTESYYLQKIVDKSDLMGPGAEKKTVLHIAENCDLLPKS